MTRAAPLPPLERRQALIEATLPLLHEHGRAVTSRQIADAAGVAEGTVFRAFGSKEELIDAALQAAFDPSGFLAALATIDPARPLRERLVEMVTLLQARFHAVFGLMHAVGMVAPPEDLGRGAPRTRMAQESRSLMVDVVRPDAPRLRMPAEDVVRILRLLTFSGSHHQISHGSPLTPEEIVGVVLDGVLKKKES